MQCLPYINDPLAVYDRLAGMNFSSTGQLLCGGGECYPISKAGFFCSPGCTGISADSSSIPALRHLLQLGLCV